MRSGDSRALPPRESADALHGGALPISIYPAPMAARIEGDQGHKRTVALWRDDDPPGEFCSSTKAAPTLPWSNSARNIAIPDHRTTLIDIAGG